MTFSWAGSDRGSSVTSDGPNTPTATVLYLLNGTVTGCEIFIVEEAQEEEISKPVKRKINNFKFPGMFLILVDHPYFFTLNYFTISDAVLQV
jgi:hypothetical protein